MNMRTSLALTLTLGLTACVVLPSQAQDYTFSTGNPDGKIATASRPATTGKIEIETADDFLLANPLSLTGGAFTGLLTGGATTADITGVDVEIYRVFPKDSVNPPAGNVPTRTNSPSDIALASRDSTGGALSFTTTLLNNLFTSSNSVLKGINPSPNQKTGGEGAVTGQEVQFNLTFNTPFDLPADHYFFIPQVQLNNGDFYWLSAPKPIVAPGTPFTPDLQTWIRNTNLSPDWLRVGTDIVGGSPYNASFSLTGKSSAIPEPGTLGLLAAGAVGGLGIRLRERRR